MSLRAVFSGATLVGAGLTLCGCRGGTEKTPAPTPAPNPAPSEVQTAWDNHFAAFGAGAGSDANTDARTEALEKILADYDSESVIATFNDKCPGSKDTETSREGYAEYKLENDGIKNFFDALFTQLYQDPATGTTGLTVGPIDNPENPVVLEGSNPEGNVFLTWKTSGLPDARAIKQATDTFSWRIKNGKAIIWKQNIVTTEDGKACPTGDKIADPCAAEPELKLCVGWKNHFDAFGAGTSSTDDSQERADALNKIMEDYTEDSIVQVYDNRLTNPNDATKAYSKFVGKEQIKGMFTQLFKDITKENPADVAVRLLEVEKDFDGVFLVWESASHPKATDTFVFDKDGKIIRQNIVVTTKEPPPELKVQV